MVEGRELGRCAIWDGEDDVIGFQKALHRLRPRDRSEETRFFYYTMVFVHATGAFMADQQPNEIPHLTGEELRQYRFPKPPFAEQAAIVRHLDATSVRRTVDHYNLDAIIAVGYRVNSYQATQFRIWATKTLKEFIIKGFVLDDERLKQGKSFGKDYFDDPRRQENGQRARGEIESRSRV